MPHSWHVTVVTSSELVFIVECLWRDWWMAAIISWEFKLSFSQTGTLPPYKPILPRYFLLFYHFLGWSVSYSQQVFVWNILIIVSIFYQFGYQHISLLGFVYIVSSSYTSYHLEPSNIKLILCRVIYCPTGLDYSNNHQGGYPSPFDRSLATKVQMMLTDECWLSCN